MPLTKIKGSVGEVDSVLKPQGIVLADKVITGFDASGLQDGAWVNFAGRDTIGDGGGGQLRFLKGSGATADGVIVHAVTGGRLVREGWSVFGVRVEWAGARGDGGLTNNALAINRAVLVCAKRGGGTVVFGQASSHYYIDGKILLPSNVMIDLNGQILRGASDSAGTMFETAYLDGDTLVSNIGTAPESRLVFYAGVVNGQVQNVGQVFNLYNFNIGCVIRDIHAENCRQVWKAARSFYAKYENVSARGGSVVGTPTYWFYDNTNAVNITKVTGTVEFPFLFEAGTTATTMTNCTTEGGGKAIKFKGDVVGFTLDGHYAEAITGTALDFTEAGTCYINFKSNYFNYVNTVMDDGGSAGATLFGTWDETNQILNAGATVEGNTYNGLMKVDGLRNFIKFTLRANTNETQTIPSNWLCSKQTDITTIGNWNGDTLNDTRAKTLFHGTGVIPVHRAGDVGAGYTDRVPFCTHYPLVPGSSDITVVVDTQIKWQPNSLFAKFVFHLADNVGTYTVFGDVFGDVVKQGDSSGKTVTINPNVSGNLQIRIAGLVHPLFSYSCTGSVQIVG